VALRAVADATLAAGSAGSMVVTPRLPGVRQDVLDEMPTLLNLVPHIPVSQAAVEYVQDVTAAADLVNRPAFVPEGGQKPDASITLSVITEPIKTVAVMHHITRQAAADVPQFMGYVDGRLRYALRRKADREILSGTGAANGLIGLLNRSGINTYAPGSSEARSISIRHGITMMEQDETIPEVIVLNPADAEIFDLSNSTTAGLHAADANGGIRQAPARTAWGLRQVRSNAIASGTAVLVDPTAMAVFDRQAITAYTTDSHGENFAFNILSLLLEARLGVGLFMPQGVCKITFNGSV
jgi:HK97 family phage major capsid protein